MLWGRDHPVFLQCLAHIFWSLQVPKQRTTTVPSDTIQANRERKVHLPVQNCWYISLSASSTSPYRLGPPSSSTSHAYGIYSVPSQWSSCSCDLLRVRSRDFEQVLNLLREAKHTKLKLKIMPACKMLKLSEPPETLRINCHLALIQTKRAFSLWKGRATCGELRSRVCFPALGEKHPQGHFPWRLTLSQAGRQRLSSELLRHGKDKIPTVREDPLVRDLLQLGSRSASPMDLTWQGSTA